MFKCFMPVDFESCLQVKLLSLSRWGLETKGGSQCCTGVNPSAKHIDFVAICHWQLCRAAKPPVSKSVSVFWIDYRNDVFTDKDG